MATGIDIEALRSIARGMDKRGLAGVGDEVRQIAERTLDIARQRAECQAALLAARERIAGLERDAAIAASTIEGTNE